MDQKLLQTIQEAVDASARMDTTVGNIDRIIREITTLIHDHHQAVSAVLERKSTFSEPSGVEALKRLEARFEQEYLRLQMMMQRENRAYTTISNVLKTKHDTVKNSIGNIR